MKIFAFGSSIVSCYWNGAATYYRGCYKYLARLGYEITFAEPDAYGRQQHRDCGRLQLRPFHRLSATREDDGRDSIAMLALARGRDIVVKHSGIGGRRCGAGAARCHRVRRRCHELHLGCRCARYDLSDACATRRCPASTPRRNYDAILTYGGGPKAREGFLEFGARAYYSHLQRARSGNTPSGGDRCLI